MTPAISVMAIALLGAVSVSPITLPSRGKQEAIVTIKKPGMYRIRASSPEGAACEMVDHLRGPFQQSGISGKENCDMSLLLDAGVYKLRLEAPEKGKGQIQLDVKPFEEINKTVLGLERRRSVEQALHPGQQASYWIRIGERTYTTLRVFGRTAGMVRLWRDGKWVEEIQATSREVFPIEGRAIYEWHISGMLEAGDYRLEVYGAYPKRWTKGKEQDFLYVQNGYTEGPPDGSISFSLPSWGQVAYEVSRDNLMGFLSLDMAGLASTTLNVGRMPDKTGDRLYGGKGSCYVAPKALVPTCAAWSGSGSRYLLTISGLPGTSGLLEWGSYAGSSTLADGQYTGVRNNLRIEGPQNGRFFVSVHDLPTDIDAPPLSCELESTRQLFGSLRVRDFLKVSDKQGFDRDVNYGGREETVWFEVTRSGIYDISTSGKLKNRCVVFRLEGDTRETVEETDPGAEECQITKHLPEGHYEVKIYGGREGIEKLGIVPRAGFLFSPETKKVTKNSCTIPSVMLRDRQAYRLKLSRRGSVSARGLVLRELPLKLRRPLPVVVEPSGQVSLEVAGGSEVLVRASGGGKFSCSWKGAYNAVSREGVCRLPAIQGARQLQISNPEEGVLVLSVRRPVPVKSLPPLVAHTPVIRPLPKLNLDQAMFFDFERGQSHSVIFDVDRAGLYHVTTLGLLATECRMRTAVVPRLSADRGSGRGRNCLLSGFLRPGRYLVTVATQGMSRGRGAVEVSERPVRKARSLSPDKEVFFQAAADELIRQELKVKKKADYQITTTGQGVSLQCLLTDREGWPLLRVPTACSLTRALDPGTYRWTQMPLTVESMRRSELMKVKPPVVLRGEKPHRIRLNEWYEAELGKDGKDFFDFKVSSDLTVQVTLSNGMQGRIYRTTSGKDRVLVQAIPPQSWPVNADLTRGAYQLETEHSRADVGISYRLSVVSPILIPGVSRNMQVPSEATLRMPEQGVLRLKTVGSTDVRCRLFDSDRKLVAESGSHGADWNCLIATPLSGGDYRLVLEPESTRGGTTRASLVSTEEKRLGQLQSGQTYRPKGKVLRAELPGMKADRLKEIHLDSPLTFSYALTNDSGHVIESRENVRHVRLLLHSLEREYSLRLWSKNWRARIRAGVHTRTIDGLSKNTIPKQGAVLAAIPRDGHYRTAAGVRCLPAGLGGLLEDCGPTASLRAGRMVFAAVSRKKATHLPLSEQIHALNGTKTEKADMSRRIHIQRQASAAKSLHLLQVELPTGEPYSPGCSIAGGVSHPGANSCFAASAPTTGSLARWWISSDRPREGRLTRWAARIPDRAEALKPGATSLFWKGAVVRLRVPSESSRMELTLPADAWALQTDESGTAVDLCPPHGKLSRCLLRGRGGELYIVSNAARRAGIELLLDHRERSEMILRDLYEAQPQAAGELTLAVPPLGLDRRYGVRGAQRCMLVLADGTRQLGCSGELRANQQAQLVLWHTVEPLRAVMFTADSRLHALWGGKTPEAKPGPLVQAKAVTLAGRITHRSFDLQKAAVVRLRADSGVCALASSAVLELVDGMGRGCDTYRLLEPGSYQFMVRSFGQVPLSGMMAWTAEPVRELSEGIGQEEWLAPGAQRIFRFTTRSPGEVGLGLQVDADNLECAILDKEHRELGRGCQQLLKIDQGSYLLRVMAPEGIDPVRFRPVILGLSGSKMDVPRDYLRDFFVRIGERL